MNQLNSLHAVTIDTRLEHRTHRVTLMPDCAVEGGEPHDPPLARPAQVGRSRVYRDEPIPAGFVRTLFARAVLLVALAAALVIGCTLFKQPAEPRAVAKVAR